MSVTTHVLDTSTGRPAVGVPVRLDRAGQTLHSGRTDDDGRWSAPPDEALEPGDYTLVFVTDGYFGGMSFHPEVAVTFRVTGGEPHLHVPLLLSPFGYTTYRGS
jgi:5-hydroxyisourate hydrolase